MYLVEMYLKDDNSFLETDLLAHFSALLSTEEHPVDVNRNTIATSVSYTHLTLPTIYSV